MAVSCNACGHTNTRETYCENCGARLDAGGPEVSFEEASLSLMLGLVCDACDTYNDPGSSHCFSCGSNLDDGAGDATVSPAAPTPAVASPAASTPAPADADDKPQTPSTPSAPAWMQAPEGSPLATVNAMKAVDLAEVTKTPSAGLAAPSGSTDAPVVVEGIHPTSPTAETLKTKAPDPLDVDPNAVTAPTKALPPPAKCPSCAEDVLADDVFCRHCGTKINVTASTKTAVMSAVNPVSAVSSPAMTTAMPSVNVGATPQSATMFFGAATTERFARLLLLKGHTQFGTQWRLQAGETVIGRSVGSVLFPDDDHLAAQHCRLVFDAGALWVHPAATTNGVFVKVDQKVRLKEKDAFVIGQQHFEVAAMEERKPFLLPTNDGTSICSGTLPDVKHPIFLRRKGTHPSLDETFLRSQRILTIGRTGCDLIFPNDPYISTRHAQLLRDDEGLLLEDLGSRNGTFLRARNPTQLRHGDQVMMGEQVLRVEIVGPA